MCRWHQRVADVAQAQEALAHQGGRSSNSRALTPLQQLMTYGPDREGLAWGWQTRAAYYAMNILCAPPLRRRAVCALRVCPCAMLLWVAAGWWWWWPCGSCARVQWPPPCRGVCGGGPSGGVAPRVAAAVGTGARCNTPAHARLSAAM